MNKIADDLKLGAFCVTPRNNEEVQEMGAFINPEEARIQVNKHPDIESENQVLASLFGLDKMKEFLNAIEVYNRNKRENQLDVSGVRIYKSLSPEFTHDSQPVDNVVLIPVYSDGQDVKRIFPAMDEKLGDLGTLKILGNARPCPRLCGDGEDDNG